MFHFKISSSLSTRAYPGIKIETLNPPSPTARALPRRPTISGDAFRLITRFPPDEAADERRQKPEYPELRSWSTLTCRILTKVDVVVVVVVVVVVFYVEVIIEVVVVVAYVIVELRSLLMPRCRRRPEQGTR